jgi:hypothetical protein
MRHVVNVPFNINKDIHSFCNIGGGLIYGIIEFGSEYHFYILDQKVAFNWHHNYYESSEWEKILGGIFVTENCVFFLEMSFIKK